MAINKLYFSTVDFCWDNHPSTLLTNKNLSNAIADTECNDYHTSVEDITYENLHLVCWHAHELFLVNIDLGTILEITNPENVLQMGRLLNEFYRNLQKVNTKQAVLDLNFSKFDICVADRKTSNTMLWTTGCSYTFGTGVNPDQRWGSILSKMLDLPESSLSKNGASITWAADQILRADINPGDTVVWGITTVPRVDYANGWKLETNTVANVFAKQIPVLIPFDYYNSLTHVIKCIHSILQVSNFCKKIGAKLYIINFLDITWLPIVFKEHPNFLDLVKDVPLDRNTGIPEPIDIGTDGLHPGPMQHKKYAELIYDFIQHAEK
jgi:hypothetical protein